MSTRGVTSTESAFLASTIRRANNILSRALVLENRPDVECESDGYAEDGPADEPAPSNAALYKMFCGLEKIVARLDATTEAPDRHPDRYLGTVQWFNGHKGFGVVLADQGRQYFFECSYPPEPRESDRVSFDVKSLTKYGKPMATNVRVLQHQEFYGKEEQ
jgi:cold shock CspA family protein